MLGKEAGMIRNSVSADQLRNFHQLPVSTRGWESHWKRRRNGAGDHATHWCRDPGRLPVEPACFMPPWIEGIYVPNIFCWFVGISRSRELRLEIRGMQSVLFRSLAPKLRLKRRGEIVQPTKEVSHRCDC